MPFSPHRRTGRRQFLQRVALLAGTGAWKTGRLLAAAPAAAHGLVAGIEREVVFRGRKTGTTWFHPRACVVPSAGGAEVLMTLQTIGGSDYFGHVHYTISPDGGRSWSEPEPIPHLGRREMDSGYQMGVCDVVPEYHPPSESVLAIGHNVYYRNGHLARPQRERWPVYIVRDSSGSWSAAHKLRWARGQGGAIYTCGCAQRVTRSDGRVIIPLSFGPKGRTHRSVTSVLCSFDGQQLTVERTGSELTNTAGRGLLEPSLAAWDGRYFMTIRAEDRRGYVASSQDGLQWTPQQPWAWEDGEPLTMSTTQQHWVVHSDGLFLVYTRQAEHNANVFRWRAPLFIARVDPSRLRLIRDSERVVLPLKGDGIKRPEHVARMGNFHPLAANPHESWVTVGETLPHDGWAGDTLLARIRWTRKNQLAPQPGARPG